MKFSELNLDNNLFRGIDEHFSLCMPVQEKTFPHSFEGKDVFVQSQTGTGKSAVFIISIFHLFLKLGTERKTTALVIVPTRELAVQIGNEAKTLGKYLNFKVGVFYGGEGYKRQEDLLRKGVDIIVGTPGRLIDFSQSGKIDLSRVGILVIDEADRLLDMGFLPDIQRLLKKMPPYPNRQTMLFSATLDDRVKEIAIEYMHEPAEIEISPERVTVDNVSQIAYHVGSNEKLNLLIGILKRDNPGNAIIFTNTKRMAVKIAAALKFNGFNSTYIIGDLPQKKRLKIIDDLKSGTLQYLVATDVAARGLHINDLELVVNYDLPEIAENYVHRIGRTARVGKSGTAISLVCEQFVYGLDDIESYTGMKIPVKWADEDLYAQVKSIPRVPRRAGKEGYARSGSRKQTTSSFQQSKRIEHEIKEPRAQKRVSHSGGHKKSQPPTGAHEKKHVPAQRARAGYGRGAASKKSSSFEDRLAYYSQKYGDTFTVKREEPEIKSSIPGVIKKLFRKKTKEGD